MMPHDPWTLEDVVEFARGNGGPTITDDEAATARAELAALRETAAARQVLEHRVRHFGLRVGDVSSAAACMARAWSRATTPEMAVTTGAQ